MWKYFPVAIIRNSIITANSPHSEVADAAYDSGNGGYPPAVRYRQIYPIYAENLPGLWDNEFITKNITCGRAAFDSVGKTEIADIVAGISPIPFSPGLSKYSGFIKVLITWV